MKYMLMFYETPADFQTREGASARTYWAGWTAYIQALTAAGVVANGQGLQPPGTATTVRLEGGARRVQDGPFADTKEQLGGFFVIDTASLDEALAWAARAPCAETAGVEVRPILPPMA
jgi:hypothetical protein